MRSRDVPNASQLLHQSEVLHERVRNELKQSFTLYSIDLSICPPICLPFCLLFYLFAPLSVCLFCLSLYVCLSVLSVGLPIVLSFCPSLCCSIYLFYSFIFRSFCSVCLSLSVSVSLSVVLSGCLSFCQSISYSVYLLFCLSVILFYQSNCLCHSIYCSRHADYLFLCLSFCCSISLSFCLSGLCRLELRLESLFLLCSQNPFIFHVI